MLSIANIKPYFPYFVIYRFEYQSPWSWY